MQVIDLLDRTARSPVTARPEDTLQTAATLLANNNIGAMPVRDGEGRLVGVLSERDIAHCFADLGKKVEDLRVQDMMSRDVVTCSPKDDVNDAMRVMSQRRIRHLPVVENGTLSGMISSRDVMEAMLEQTVLERDVLRDYAIAAR